LRPIAALATTMTTAYTGPVKSIDARQ